MSIKVWTDHGEQVIENGSHWDTDLAGYLTVYDDDDNELAEFSKWTGVFKV